MSNLILNLGARCVRERLEYSMEIVALLEGVEPNDAADGGYDDRVRNKHHVERNEHLCRVVRLHDGRDGERKGDEEEDAQHQARWAGCQRRNGTCGQIFSPVKSCLEIVMLSRRFGMAKT
jgi:hypothetical protein